MSKQSKMPLFEALVAYQASNPIAYDVPGHKLGKGINPQYKEFIGENLFKIDVNSMKELDNLSNPIGVIKEAEDLASELFEVDHVFFIVNGSTSGVQNMILSAINHGDKIILPRNIHKSAINALVLSGAVPVYIDTIIDKNMGISIGSSKNQIIQTINENKDAKAILLLNPTYHGYTIDLDEIIDYAHSLDMIVLIDESHGTHYYFDDRYGKPSMRKADMSTISVHKTGGSLTQSSMLLLNEGRISQHKVRSVINIMQTSSASYILMSSLDAARHHLANNKHLIPQVYELSEYAIKTLSQIDHIKVESTDILQEDTLFKKDISKLTINTKELGFTGFEVYDYLKEEFNIQAEVGELYVVVFVISLGDSTEDIDRLKHALESLPKKARLEPVDVDKFILDKPEIVLSPREAFFMETEYVDLDQSVSRISGDQIMVYPPGIPLVVGGEKITEQIVYKYKKLIEYGNCVIGSVNNSHILIKVVKERINEE